MISDDWISNCCKLAFETIRLILLYATVVRKESTGSSTVVILRSQDNTEYSLMIGPEKVVHVRTAVSFRVTGTSLRGLSMNGLTNHIHRKGLPSFVWNLNQLSMLDVSQSKESEKRVPHFLKRWYDAVRTGDCC